MINKTRVFFNVLGSFLVFFHNGPYYYWGNLSVYIMSYYALSGQKVTAINDHEVSQGNVTRPALALTFFPPSWLIAMFFGGYVTSKSLVHPRILIFIAIILQNLAFVACYALMDVNLTAVFTIFGLLVGFGTGLYEGIIIQHYAVKLSKAHRASMASFVISGGAAGGVFIVLLATCYTNPNNLPLTSHYGQTQIFVQEEILNKVPDMLLIMAGSLTLIQLFGMCLVTNSAEDRCVIVCLRENEVKDIDVQEETFVYSQSSDREYQSTNTRDTYGVKEVTEISQMEINLSEKEESYTPGKLLRSSDFYKLAVVYMLGATSRIVATTYYKLYGQELIHDDHFLTLLGTAEALSVIPSSLAWGAAMDYFGVKTTLVYVYSSMPLTLLLMYFSAHLNKWAYFVASLSATASANVYVCFNVATLLWFGKDYYAINLAIIESAAILSVMVTSSFLDALIAEFGYFAEFCLASSLGVVGLLVVILTLPYRLNKTK